MPAAKLTMLAFFPSVRAAGAAVSAITSAGVVPVTLELLDRFTMRAVDAALHVGLDPDAGAMLMIESDAGGAAAEAELDAAAEQPASGPGPPRSVRSHRPHRGRLAARGSPQGALVAGAGGRGADGGRGRAAQSRGGPARRDRGHRGSDGVRIGVFGHAGDGNFHPRS